MRLRFGCDDAGTRESSLVPQIFHPSMNTISRVSIFGLVFFLLAAVGVAAALVRSPYFTEQGVVRVQPVPFSHQHHVGDAGIDCRYCHQTVEDNAFAGMPSTELCMDCHSQLWRESLVLEPVRQSFETGEPLHWVRVHDLSDFAFFHHGAHIQKGIDCAVCHGEVDKMPLMYREETLHMEWCLECHRNPDEYLAGKQMPTLPELPIGKEVPEYHRQAKTNCSHCHR